MPGATRRLGPRARRPAHGDPARFIERARDAGRRHRPAAHRARLRRDRPRLRARGDRAPRRSACSPPPSTRRSSRSSSTCPTTCPSSRRSAAAARRCASACDLLTHGRHRRAGHPPPRRLPPRPGRCTPTTRLGHPRLRGRARAHAGRAPAQALAAARRRRDAALVRLRRQRVADPATTRRRPTAGRTRCARGVPRGLPSSVDQRLLPPGQAAIERLIAVFELEKAVYELRYELDNRPDWASHPGGRDPAPARSSTPRRPHDRRSIRKALGAHPENGARRRARLPPGGRPRRRAHPTRPPADVELQARAATGSSRACVEDAELPLRYELEVAYPDGNTFTLRDPYSLPADARRARPAPGRRGPPRGALRAARRARRARSTA